MNKCYVAGRIRGIPDYAKRFAEAADNLRGRGYDVFNPAAANQEGRSLREIMAYLLPQLCECDVLALIPGWWTRFGGTWIEYLLARYLGLKILYL